MASRLWRVAGELLARDMMVNTANYPDIANLINAARNIRQDMRAI